MSEDSEDNREPLPTKAWTLSTRTIEDSIQRCATGPGSRGSQNFLMNFIAKGSCTRARPGVDCSGRKFYQTPIYLPIISRETRR